jgi:glycosyltransferase involved in cell wall biosynthesis
MMNFKSIAFVIHGLPMGGAEKFMISIVNHLFEIKYDPVVILLSNDDTLANEINAGIPIIKVLKKSRYDLSVSHRIKQQILAHGANKIFCVNPYSYFLTKLAFLFEQDYKIFLSPHTTKPFSWYNWFQTFVYYRLIGKHDTLVYLCKKQQEYLTKTYLLPHCEQAIIYNGINTETFNPAIFEALDRDKIRASFSLDRSDKLILLVARINPEKRHTDALQALSIIHKMQAVIKPHLMIVGAGNKPLSDKLKALVSFLSLDGYVHFVGNHSDVRIFYYIADIFTLTSESETFSIAALEAMAFGLPCALTDVGGAREMIVEDWNGTLANPLHPDSIANAWLNALKNNKNGLSIRENVERRFSLPNMLNHYVNLLSQPLMH